MSSDAGDKTGIHQWSRFWLDRSEVERDAFINLVQVERRRRRAAAAAAAAGEVVLDHRAAVNKFINGCGGPIVAAKVRALCLLHASTACVSQVMLALSKTSSFEHFNAFIMSNADAGFIFSKTMYKAALVLLLACACLCVTLVVFAVGTLQESTRFVTHSVPNCSS